jgi:hypothetical protein
MLQKITLLAVFMGLSSVLMFSAPQMANENAAQTITGCLQKGTEDYGGFFLLSTDNKHWELYPTSDVALADHVGHTVTVTGTVTHRSKAQEEKSQPSEQKEISGKKHADLQVTSVKMVSESCK